MWTCQSCLHHFIFARWNVPVAFHSSTWIPSDREAAPENLTKVPAQTFAEPTHWSLRRVAIHVSITDPGKLIDILRQRPAKLIGESALARSSLSFCERGHPGKTLAAADAIPPVAISCDLCSRGMIVGKWQGNRAGIWRNVNGGLESD